MTKVALAVLTVSLMLAPCARAQDTETVADVRCLVVALDMSTSPDPQMRGLATAAGLYFVGRLKGRAPALDLEAAIVQQFRTMTQQDRWSEGRRCGTVLASQADTLAVVGEHLRGLAAPRSPPAPEAPPLK